MVLDCPGVLELRIWPLEPLTRLYTVLAASHKRDHALRIETSGIVDRLKEDIVQLIRLRTMFGRSSRDLVDGLESNTAAFARKFRADLVP